MTDKKRDSEVIRELTFDERATWGECPACHAKHGEPCDWTVGYNPAWRDMYVTEKGAHLGRIWNAPKRVHLVPADE